MNLRASYKYQLTENKKPMIIYMSIIVAVTLFLYLATVFTLTVNGVKTEFTSMEFASVIFLFVTGLCSFKDSFLMLTQNGVSRKTMFFSSILTFATLSGILTAFGAILLLLVKLFDNEKILSTGMYETVYYERAASISGFLMNVESIILNFFVLLMALGIGYLITTLFYRLNKAGKIAVGVGVPVFFTMVLPVFDFFVTGGRISYTINQFIDFASGYSTQNPYAGIISSICVFAIASGLSWLLMRKAVVKA
jgi:hypothetical protein